MTKIDRHISQSVLLSMLVVISLISSVILVFAVADELTASNDNYTILNALTFVLKTTPTSIYELLPFSALGGALIGLGILASNNELVVIQAAGVSTWRIVWAVMKPTLGVMLLSLLLGEYISPSLQQSAESNKALQLSGDGVIGAGRGNWRKVGNEFVHINAIAPGGELLYGLSRYELNEDRELIAASFAETASYMATPQGGFWRLNNVRKSLISAERISPQSYLQEDWHVDLSPQMISVLLVKSDEQSITGLYKFARFFENQGVDSSQYFLSFWKKLLQPISTAVLVLLAISFVFGPLREATMGYRVFIAIGVGIVFTILQRVMEPLSLLYGFSPLVAVLIPIALCAAVGMFFMTRVR